MAIINVYSGAFPWKRQSKKKDAEAGYQWNVGIATAKGGKRKGSTGPYVTGGFTPANTGSPEMVTLNLYGRRKSQVPIGDVEEFMAFNKIPPEQVTEAIAAEVTKAFEKPDGRGRYYVCEGVGHISDFRYNPSMQILEMHYKTDGATVVFLRVPMSIYSEFEHHATSGSMGLGVDGKQRHLLGIRVWDMLRIRGQRTGGRFPYTYTTDGIRAGNGASEYADNMLRAYSPQAQQRLDAQREATVTLQEEAPPAEKEAIDKEVKKDKFTSTYDTSSVKYNKAQSDDLDRWGDAMIEKFHDPRAPIYKEMDAAIDRGYAAVKEVAKRYKLF